MCFYPKLRITLDHSERYKVWDYDLFKPPLAKGWNKKNRAYVIDCRDQEYLKNLLNCYGQSIAQDIQQIPCGQCMECRIKWSKELAQRALAESTLHDESYFVTLTYNDKNLPFKDNIFPLSGKEPGLHPVLDKRDFELFAKLLRQWCVRKHDKQIKIFYCGEYGELNSRPHFHAIIYGLPIKDTLKTKRVFSNKKGKWLTYEESYVLDKCWKKGDVTVAPVTWETCAYVARYVTKKRKGIDKQVYFDLCDSFGCEPQPLEFHQSPKRPGLGLEYLQANIDAIYQNDKIVLPGGFTAKPCKYFDDKFDLEYPEQMEAIKEHRRAKMDLIEQSKFVEFIKKYGLDVNSDDFIEQCESLMLKQRFEGYKLLENQVKERKYSKLKRDRI